MEERSTYPFRFSNVEQSYDGFTHDPRAGVKMALTWRFGA